MLINFKIAYKYSLFHLLKISSVYKKATKLLDKYQDAYYSLQI